jgi:hypothetical protein
MMMARDTYALNQSLEFIRSSLSNLDVASQFECEKGEATILTGSARTVKFQAIG